MSTPVYDSNINRLEFARLQAMMLSLLALKWMFQTGPTLHLCLDTVLSNTWDVGHPKQKHSPCLSSCSSTSCRPQRSVKGFGPAGQIQSSHSCCRGASPQADLWWSRTHWPQPDCCWVARWQVFPGHHMWSVGWTFCGHHRSSPSVCSCQSL